MTKTSKPIIFFGTESFSARFLEALINDGYDVHTVVTKPDSKKGRGQKITAPLVKEVAETRGIPVLQPVKLSEIAGEIASIGDVAGVLVSYGKIIPENIIELFSPGIINVHPSLLPRYRGPSPVESAIVNGDEETGVSIMQLSAKMDAGPVYSQVTYPLTGEETRPDLYEALASAGIGELLRVLPPILDGSLQPTIQNDIDATYCQLLTKQDGVLRPKELTAIEAERRVRAFLDFPKTRLNIDGRPIVVTKAHVSGQQKTPLDVMFSDGQYLSIDQLVATSGKTMSAEAFRRGYGL